MRFKVLIVEETPSGMGMGCGGTFLLHDEILERLTWNQVQAACEGEMTSLFLDMIRTMRGLEID